MLGSRLAVKTVRIASWNCFGAAQSARAFLLREGAPDPHRFRHPEVSAALHRADVLCLQELWVRDAEALFERLPHPHKAKDDNRTEWWPLTIGGSGLGVASRHPIVSRQIVPFSRPHSGAERFARKGVLHARVDVDGVEVDVVTTHFQSGTSAGSRRVRERHARELGNLLRTIGDERPIVLTGDFNVDGQRSARADEYAVLAGQLSGFEDVGAEADVPTYHPHPHHNLLAHRFDRDARPQRIDYVFFRPPRGGGARVTGFVRTLDALLPSHEGATETHASDHFALEIELEITR